MVARDDRRLLSPAQRLDRAAADAAKKMIDEHVVRFGRQSEPPARQTLADELALLSQLHQSGALTDDEFSAAKRRLL